MKTQSNEQTFKGTAHEPKPASALAIHARMASAQLCSALRRKFWIIARAAAVLMVLLVGGVSVAQAAQLILEVVSARTEPNAFGGLGVTKGDPVVEYKYIINVDNTGTTEQRSPIPGTGCSPQDAGYPANCHWTSVAGAKSSSPVLTQGTQDDFYGTPNYLVITPGRYLVSVLADGYRLDGQHFTVDENNNVLVGGIVVPGGILPVLLQPTPLPDATIQSAVFEDVSPVNSGPDLPAEHGLAGFQGHILDTLGEVTTNVYGDPLCSKYDSNGELIPGSGGVCLSACYVVFNGVDVGTVAPIDTAGRCPNPADGVTGVLAMLEGGTAPVGSVIEGKVKIPNLGPSRYTLSVTPPNGSGWIQTTTLEGNHDWDAWVMEGATGLDTEFLIGGEPFPAIVFGYVPTPGTPSAEGSALVAGNLGGTGSIKGVVEKVKIYVPTTGGVGGLPGEIWGGLQGAVVDKPIENPVVTLTNLGNGDTIVWSGQGNAAGEFTIPNVPAGTYTLTWWDEPQNHILDLVNVTVAEGENVDMGILPLTGWWTVFDGYVFDDTNRNGIRDPGEQGLAGYGLTMRRRDNSLMDRGTTATTTDADGYYRFEAGYPMTQWLVIEAYDDAHYGTGVTYQADNQPTPTTVLGAGVDVSVLPIIGLSGRMDWGKHTYDATGATNGVDPRNGGIVGTITYDTTRNELDPRYAAAEDWQPSIPDLVVKLYQPLPADPGCERLNFAGSNAATATCDASGLYQLEPTSKAIAKGPLLNTYLSETWFRPGSNGSAGCIVRGANGVPVTAADQQFLPGDQEHSECLEAPMTGVQFSPEAANVNGNYGFGDGCFAPNVLDATDPAAPVCRASASDTTPVEFTTLPGDTEYLVEVDLKSLPDLKGNPIYKVTREEDINIGNGDAFVPAALPSACAGALHTVDVAGLGDDGPNATINPTFVDIGGSPYEGQQRPLCDVKLVRLSNGASIAPTFNIFTDVPLPGRHWFIIIDDLNFSSNPRSTTFGEKAGMPFVPVGIYDYTNRLVTTVESDYNGLADVLLPSTNRINCPTPSGVCTNLYRYVGNDPGVPGRLNPNFNPTYRTISAEFEVMPGAIIPADLAPTQVGVTVQLPGGQTTSPVMCMLDDAQPQLYRVNDPVITPTSRNLVIDGKGFGTAGTLSLGGTAVATTAWSDSQISATIPPTVATGPYQLMVTRTDNGQSLVNGLTVHVTTGGSVVSIPTINARDNFNNNNANSLGNSWSQVTILGAAATRRNAQQAFGAIDGGAIWNGNGSNAGSTQGAAISFANPIVANTGLVLKAVNGIGTNALPQSYISVVYNGGNVDVRTTTTSGLAHRIQGSLPATFAAGDTLTAAVNDTGVVYVWKTTPTNVTTSLGSVALASTGLNTGNFVNNGGRFGILVPATARVDNFGGGSVALSGGSGYNPEIFAVGPGKTYAPAETLPAAADHAIQRALDAAATFVGQSPTNANRGALVVVYPNATSANPRQNPRGAYYENLIITSKVKLQGVGPGSPTGATVSGTQIGGSIIDGGAFAGDSPVATDWYTRIEQETTVDPDTGNAIPNWGGNATIYDGAVISLYLPTSGNKAFPAAGGATDLKTAPSIDGFDLRGGNQQGFPGNINVIGGTPTGLPGGLITQGGAIFANAYANHLQVTNNVVQNNGGAYGTIRIGTPDLTGDPSSYNADIYIGRNRVITNAGTNQAGGIGLFAGSDRYQVSRNDICGNFSSEYGGGLSAVGLSPGGSIDNNRIYFNRSFDEGGGIMIAGALPATPTSLSPGSGAVSIFNNLIQGNLSNDDGGGIRFLMAGNYAMDVYNNFIVNNVATHEGGGIALNDAPNVRFYNNTVMKNLTTATAITSDGSPAPAGLSTSQNSSQLQATLTGPTLACGAAGKAACFSNPLMFNNIFWDNRAGRRTGATVTGLSLADADHYDFGVPDGTQLLSPTNSIVQQANAGVRAFTPSASNKATDPQVVTPYDMGVTFNSWRNNPGFLGAILISADLPPQLLGDYHLLTTSPAINSGAPSKTPVNAPLVDIDNQARPIGASHDIGADEVAGTATNPSPSTGRVTFTSATLGLLNVSSSTLNFGSLSSGTNLSTITLTVGTAPVTFGAVTVQRGNGSRFDEIGGSCQNSTVAAGGTCTVVVNFNGDGNTLRTGALTVNHNGVNGPATLVLTGQ